jgi:hypothetical protein
MQIQHTAKTFKSRGLFHEKEKILHQNQYCFDSFWKNSAKFFKNFPENIFKNIFAKTKCFLFTKIKKIIFVTCNTNKGPKNRMK